MFVGNERLASIDLGNVGESIKNKNRLGNEGLKAIIEGIVESHYSTISELFLQSTCITSKGMQVFQALKSDMIDLQVLDLSSN